MAAMLAFCFLGWEFLSKASKDPASKVFFEVKENGNNIKRAAVGMVIASFWIMVRSVAFHLVSKGRETDRHFHVFVLGGVQLHLPNC